MPVPPRDAFRLPRRREGLWGEMATWAGLIAAAVATAAMLSGCAVAGGKTQLAAADAMDRAATELSLAVAEYGRDLETCDDERRARVIEAYTNRVRTDVENPAALADHQAQFILALERLDSDQDTARMRAANARENLGVVREIASGLRQQAIAAMKLEAQTSAYLTTLLERQNNDGALGQPSGTGTEGTRP